MTEKVVKVSESLFRPANGVQSIRLLVEIHTGGAVLLEERRGKVHFGVGVGDFERDRDNIYIIHKNKFT